MGVTLKLGTLSEKDTGIIPSFLTVIYKGVLLVRIQTARGR